MRNCRYSSKTDPTLDDERQKSNHPDQENSDDAPVNPVKDRSEVATATHIR